MRAGPKVAAWKILGEFFIVWGPGNSQGQIFPQFAFSQSPKILEVRMSPKLGQVAHSWDFISPECDNDGKRLAVKLIRLIMAAASAS